MIAASPGEPASGENVDGSSDQTRVDQLSIFRGILVDWNISAKRESLCNQGARIRVVDLGIKPAMKNCSKISIPHGWGVATLSVAWIAGIMAAVWFITGQFPS